MSLAVVARAGCSLGIEIYAADIEGTPMAPWPAPRANKDAAGRKGESRLWVIHRKGSVPNMATIVQPAEIARQPNLSVKNPGNGYTDIIPRPIGASIQPAFAGEIPQPVIRKSGTSICLCGRLRVNAVDVK
jgi:hypothetical protein